MSDFFINPDAPLVGDGKIRMGNGWVFDTSEYEGFALPDGHMLRLEIQEFLDKRRDGRTVSGEINRAPDDGGAGCLAAGGFYCHELKAYVRTPEEKFLPVLKKVLKERAQ
jgi:hypothetical protein